MLTAARPAHGDAVSRPAPPAPVVDAAPAPPAPPPLVDTDRVVLGAVDLRARFVTPLASQVGGIGSDLLWSIGLALQKGWLRISGAAGTGVWAGCSPCSPFARPGAYLAEGRAGVRVARDVRWDVWVEGGYGWFGGRDSGRSDHVQALETTASLVWRLGPRVRAVGVTVDGHADVWFSGRSAAPAAGFGGGLVVPF